MHIAGAIVCATLAGILMSYVVEEWDGAPAWVNGLALVAIVVLLVSAARIYLSGARRKRQMEGPRTKIVLEPSSPPAPRVRKPSDRD